MNTKKNKLQKYLIFGTGEYYQRYKFWFQQNQIVAFIDNSKEKQNTYIDGIKVYSPEEGINLNYNKIIILSFHVKEMKAQLEKLGVDETIIVHFFYLYKIINVKEFAIEPEVYGADKQFIQTRTLGKKVLLLSHDLIFGGPELALLHVAEVLKKQGMFVEIGSMLDGPLKQEFLNLGIPVVIDRRLQIVPMSELEWVSNFSMIWCNTISFYVFLSNRNSDMPIIWWLHDSEYFYNGVDVNLLESIEKNNLKILSVGPVPKRAFQKYNHNIEVDNLLYGVNDRCDINNKTSNNDKMIRFLVIGFFEERKGQDILIKVIKNILEKNRKILFVDFVGRDDSLYGKKIIEECREIEEIKFWGVLSQSKVHELIDNCDVLICPSREDPMPTVVTEAMLHATPSIVSDVIGTATYITNRENGLVFQNENVEDLQQQIEYCLNNKNRLNLMGEKARITYEKYFSMKCFEENVNHLVKGILAKNDSNDTGDFH